MEIIWLRIKIWITSFLKKETNYNDTYLYEENE